MLFLAQKTTKQSMFLEMWWKWHCAQKMFYISVKNDRNGKFLLRCMHTLLTLLENKINALVNSFKPFFFFLKVHKAKHAPSWRNTHWMCWNVSKCVSALHTVWVWVCRLSFRNTLQMIAIHLITSCYSERH